MDNIWHYKSPIGTFIIEQDSVNFGRWALRVGKRALGSYQSPRLAAIAVAAQRTGYAPWDELQLNQAPLYLERWEPGDPETSPDSHQVFA